MSVKPRIYIYCRNEEGNLQEDIIALAEGFRELGIPYHGNCDYWLQSAEPGDYLIRHDPDIGPDDCDIVIVSYTWPYWIRMGTFDLVRQPLPENLFHVGRKYKTVYMDNHDGHRTISWEAEYRQFDMILRSKLNRRAWHPENMRAWALGLNNRILDATNNAALFAQRRKSILINFGASHPYPHGTRDAARKYFEPKIRNIFELDRIKDDLSHPPADPYDVLMWRQTGGRFSRNYYERLKRSQAVACFCGELIPPAPFRNPEIYLVGGRRAKLRRLLFEALAQIDFRPRRSVQWDSFRFWEALAAGCAVFNIDLDYYGAMLPVMPENGKHYFGLKLSNASELVDRLADDPASIEKVARDGRNWAIANYTPANVARRFLNALRFPLPSESSTTRTLEPAGLRAS